MKHALFALLGVAVTAGTAVAEAAIKGHYIEARSCDVYTGSCFANAEMGLSGEEAIMVWNITEGAWNGVALDGLSVIAVVKADETLGDMRQFTKSARTILVLDEAADTAQREALEAFVRNAAGKLANDVVDVRFSAIEAELGTCDKTGGCGSVSAGELIQISTRCLNGKDHVCGNEEVYYPPLTKVSNAVAAYTDLAKFTGEGLGITWNSANSRGAFLAQFAY